VSPVILATSTVGGAVADVGTGVVAGGSEYVTAAYAVSWILLGGYVLSLFVRSPRGGPR